MACGVSGVAGDVGGMFDMIIHQENGQLATAFDDKEFSEGILYCVRHGETLSSNAQKAIKDRFSMDVIGRRYNQLMLGISKNEA